MDVAFLAFLDTIVFRYRIEKVDCKISLDEERWVSFLVDTMLKEMQFGFHVDLSCFALVTPGLEERLSSEGRALAIYI